jgi:acyl carrier protein
LIGLDETGLHEVGKMNDTLERELVAMVIDLCNVEDILPEDVSLDMPMIGPESPLGLDSLDALEVVVAVQRLYDVRIGGENSSREILQSFTTLANYIRLKQQEDV